MSDITTKVNEILEINDSYQAPQKIMDILYGDIAKRNKVFREMADLFKNNWSFDWFHEYFQNEHADRKTRKQDHTPESVSKLINKLTADGKGDTLDIAAGTGGLIITRWDQDRMQDNPFTYRPSDYFYQAEDLSDRSIPFLLLNLVIRGMNAVVIHGDSLTRRSYGAFFIQNDKDDFFSYSSLNLLPYDKSTEDMLRVKFVEERYEHIKQSKIVPTRIVDEDRFKKERNHDNSFKELIEAMAGIRSLNLEKKDKQLTLDDL